MKKVTLLLTMCFIASFGLINAQNFVGTEASSSINNEGAHQSKQFPNAYYKATTAPEQETVNGIENTNIPIDIQGKQIPSLGAYGPAAKPDGIDGFGENLIYTNGPYINDRPDLSILEDVSEGMDTYGAGAQIGSDNSVAEDFSLPMDFDITSIDVYAYQTGATPPSITAVYMQIWDGDPSGGSASVIWGDLSTNILDDVEDTGVYRVLESDQSGTSRKIQKVTASTSGLSLPTGTYWVEYSFEGSGSSGPWAPPVAVIGETITGNAIQNTGGTWQALVDGGTGDPQGLPIQMYGVADLGGNSCVEMNPPYEFFFEDGARVDPSSGSLVANDLTLEANESFTLQNITAFFASEWPMDNVDATYYEDDNGVPGAMIGSESSVTIDNVNAIGSANGAPLSVYEVNLTVDPFEFTGQENSATTYWIQLSATSSQNTEVYWVGTFDNIVGNELAIDNGSGWNSAGSNFDGLYTWSGDCSPVLGVEENEFAQFQVYPNPTDDVLYLETNKNIESISLFNLLGQELMSKNIDKNSTEISLSNLPVGTYILRTIVEGKINTQKVIKK